MAIFIGMVAHRHWYWLALLYVKLKERICTQAFLFLCYNPSENVQRSEFLLILYWKMDFRTVCVEFTIV